MDALAEASEHTAGQLAMAWLLAKPQVTSVITGTSRIASLEESVGSLNVKLTDKQQNELDSLAQMV
jgi:aryl-alcohol dehydrogenase-like predicted oxidoreductase